MRKLIKFLPLFLCLVLTSCSYEKLMSKLTPDADEEFIQTMFTAIQKNNYDFFLNNCNSDLQQEITVEAFENLANYIPAGEYISCTQIGYQTYRTDDKKLAKLSYEYKYAEDKFLSMSFTYEKNDSRKLLTYVYLVVTTETLKAQHKFTFKGKTFAHVIFFLLAIIIPVYIIFMFVLCLRQKKFKNKALWAIWILLGIIAFEINWTTGALRFSLLSVYLLGCGISCTPYNPIYITIAIPFGALLFWFKKYRLDHPKDSEKLD
ncbi:MAG: hypothetical protein MJ179_04030 [Treponema sp.]|nr:hypothetical protein [Treponema sp.]